MADANVHPIPIAAYDASDPEQVRKAELKAARKEKERREVLVQLLSTPAGRAWMWSLLSESGMYRSSFFHCDPHATSFNEGRRNFSLYMLSEIVKVDPQAYVLMQTEAEK